MSPLEKGRAVGFLKATNREGKGGEREREMTEERKCCFDVRWRVSKGANGGDDSVSRCGSELTKMP